MNNKINNTVTTKLFYQLKNQSQCQRAPKPQVPEASDDTTKSGKVDTDGERKNDIPFHSWKNDSHHCRSRQNSRFNRIGWSRLRKQHNKSIIRWRNVRPGTTTRQAWWRDPLRDSSSQRVQVDFLDQDWRRRSIQSTLSGAGGGQASHLLNRIQLDTEKNHNSSRTLAFLMMQGKTQAVKNRKRGVNMGLTKGGVQRTQSEKVL